MHWWRKIPVVKEYTYLGIPLDGNMKLSKAASTIAGKLKGIAARLRKLRGRLSLRKTSELSQLLIGGDLGVLRRDQELPQQEGK